MRTKPKEQPWEFTDDQIVQLALDCTDKGQQIISPFETKVALEAQRMVISWLFGQCIEHNCKTRDIPRWDCPKCVDMLLKGLKIGEEKP